MAIDNRQKRAAILGVARPWYRNSNPAIFDDKKRATIGNTYPLQFLELIGSNSSFLRIISSGDKFRVVSRG